MNVIFGFGDYHINRSKEIAGEILNTFEGFGKEWLNLDEKEVVTFCKKIQASILDKYGKFTSNSGDEYNIIFFGFFDVVGEKGDLIISMPLTINHYRNDHPLSLDGFACLGTRFILTFIIRNWSSDARLITYLAEGGSNEFEFKKEEQNLREELNDNELIQEGLKLKTALETDGLLTVRKEH